MHWCALRSPVSLDYPTFSVQLPLRRPESAAPRQRLGSDRGVLTCQWHVTSLATQALVTMQVEGIATAECQDGKPSMRLEDAINLRYDPPQTQESAQPSQVTRPLLMQCDEA